MLSSVLLTNDVVRRPKSKRRNIVFISISFNSECSPAESANTSFLPLNEATFYTQEVNKCQTWITMFVKKNKTKEKEICFQKI